MSDNRVFTDRTPAALGPLTTTWTPPSTCSLYMGDCPDCTVVYAGQRCDDSGQVKDAPDCWPPRASGVVDHPWPFTGWGVYSPGIVCPSGYNTACSAEYGKKAEWSVEFPLSRGETALGCCPSGFTCANINGNTCIRTATSTLYASVANCDGNQVTDVKRQMYPKTTETTRTVTNGDNFVGDVILPVTLLAPMFQLNHQQSDLPTKTQSEVAGDTMTANAGSSLVGGAVSTTPASANSSSKHTLSSGAKAGIGVGVAIGALLILAVVGLLFWRRRKSAANAGSHGTDPSSTAEKFYFGGQTQPAELPAMAPVEVPGSIPEQRPTPIGGYTGR